MGEDKYLKTYVWATYTVEGLHYSYKAPDTNSGGQTYMPDKGEQAFARNLIILSREAKISLEILWEVPPGTKNTLTACGDTSPTNGYEFHRELAPFEKISVISELKRALSGK